MGVEFRGNAVLWRGGLRGKQELSEIVEVFRNV